MHGFYLPRLIVPKSQIPIRANSFRPFYSASSSPSLLRSTSDTARILCRSFTPKSHRQLRVKDLPKVPTWQLDRDSNPRPSGRKASTLPKRHHVPRSDFRLFPTEEQFFSVMSD